jgi:hypothetical protein
VRKLLAVGAATVLLWAAACSSADDDPTDTTRSNESSGDSATSGTDDTRASDDTSDDAADGASRDSGDGESLGSSTARLPADPNDATPVPLRLDVTALERLQGRVEVRLLLTNEGRGGTPAFEPWSTFVDPRLSAGEAPWSLAGASLVDGEAKKAYLTIIDSEGVCLCSGDLDSVSVPPGESVELYADFGGVPDDVERIDVQVPGFPPVTEVPIS